MSAFLAFRERYRDEAGCARALAGWRWPEGYRCRRCGGRRCWQLKVRPRVFECAGCGGQQSVTAGTVFHRSRIGLPIWFLAAWWMARDKRGVSALFLSRALGLRYATAWLLAHKLRHGLDETGGLKLDGLIEVDESYYGGRGKPESRGRGRRNPNKSLLAMAVEKRPAGPRQGKGVKASGFVAGRARLAVLAAASQSALGGFVRQSVAAGSRLSTDAFQGYRGLEAAYRHRPQLQGPGRNAERLLPIVHVLFSNLKTWLNGTHHGVSAKHLPRYAREWSYRFNRRHRHRELADLLLRRAATRPTLTYCQLVDGLQPQEALPASTG